LPERAEEGPVLRETRAPGNKLRQAIDLYKAGRYVDAEALCGQVLGDCPGNPDALEIAALCLSRQNRRAESVTLLERAVEIAPARAPTHYNLGVTYQELGQQDNAMLAYCNCLRLDPRHADALWNLGDLYRLNEHFADAVQCFDRLIEMRCSYRDLHHRLGVALHGLGDDTRAAAAFEQALAADPGDPALTRWEYSHVLLTRGDFGVGWDCYDQRFSARGTGVVCHPFPYARWRGEPLAAKTLLIHGEQGLGDEMMFGSIVPELIDEAGSVVLACQPSLVRLLSQSLKSVTVRPHSVASGHPADVSDLEPIDFHIPIGSLAGLRRRELNDFSRQRAYLCADSKRAKHFGVKLELLAPDTSSKFKVGLVWGANPAHGIERDQRRARQKSVPLQYFKPLAALRDRVVFVSLQNRDIGAQAAHAPWLDLADFHGDLLDMADTAALIENLDLVITVDTSIAHLAGAMGKSIWVLLMQRADFRWLRDTDKSIWYPCARLFRQTRQGDWEPVIARVVDALRESL